MHAGRLLSTLVVLGLVVVPCDVAAQSGSGVTIVVPAPDVGSGSGSATVPNPAPSPVESLPDDGTAIAQAAKAVSSKDWFLLAGAVLALLIHAARALLKRRWPAWDKSHYAVLLAAAMAGLASLAIAWLTPGADMASSHTLIGALKLLAAATLTYVLPKKVAEGMNSAA